MIRRTIQIEERLPLLETIPLSLQHLFAMFGATVLVPFLFGVNPSTSLLMNGIGTLVAVAISLFLAFLDHLGWTAREGAHASDRE